MSSFKSASPGSFQLLLILELKISDDNDPPFRCHFGPETLRLLLARTSRQRRRSLVRHLGVSQIYLHNCLAPFNPKYRTIYRSTFTLGIKSCILRIYGKCQIRDLFSGASEPWSTSTWSKNADSLSSSSQSRKKPELP